MKVFILLWILFVIGQVQADRKHHDNHHPSSRRSSSENQIQNLETVVEAQKAEFSQAIHGMEEKMGQMNLKFKQRFEDVIQENKDLKLLLTSRLDYNDLAYVKAKLDEVGNDLDYNSRTIQALELKKTPNWI
jgi:hypothetical protein